MRLYCNKFIIATFILFSMFLLGGCTSKNDDSIRSANKQITLSQEQEKNAKIKTEMLQNRLLQMSITIPAQFKAINKFLDKAYAPLNGIVTDVFVEPGDVVKKGTPLIKIKSDVIGQIELEFLSQYLEIDSLAKQMSAQCNLSNLTYKREHTLFNEGISSRAEYEVARAQMLKDRANLSSLKMQKSALIQMYSQRIALYGASYGAIRRVLATRSIYPFIVLHSNNNGVVVERKVNPGEIIEQNRSLFEVADLSTIWLVGYAFEKDAPHLKIGQDVVGEFEKEHGKTVKGKLSYVASMLDSDKKTLEVIADIPNNDYSLKPNMYAEMKVNLDKITTLAIPNVALQKYGDYTFAYVKVRPHVYEERKVQIGEHNSQYSQVISGLKEGEMVVSNGAFMLLGEAIKKSEE